jgi:hypothetical protein
MAKLWVSNDIAVGRHCLDCLYHGVPPDTVTSIDRNGLAQTL